jgi:hypothetical protein
MLHWILINHRECPSASINSVRFEVLVINPGCWAREIPSQTKLSVCYILLARHVITSIVKVKAI